MQKAKVFKVIFAILVTFVNLSEAHFPLTRCPVDDSPCLTKQAQKFLKEFVSGIPMLGIKTLDKLPIEPIVVTADDFFFNWTNVKAVGLKDSIIDNVSIDMELKTLRVLFHTDMILEFYSELRGVLLSVLPTFGSGSGYLILKTMQMEMLFVFDIVKDENGKDAMDLKTFYHGYDTAGGVLTDLENLYDGDKKKSDQFHKIVNESWRIMFTNFGAFFQRKITSKIFNAVKTFMRSQPLEDLFLI